MHDGQKNVNVKTPHQHHKVVTYFVNITSWFSDVTFSQFILESTNYTA